MLIYIIYNNDVFYIYLIFKFKKTYNNRICLFVIIRNYTYFKSSFMFTSFFILLQIDEFLYNF